MVTSKIISVFICDKQSSTATLEDKFLVIKCAG